MNDQELTEIIYWRRMAIGLACFNIFTVLAMAAAFVMQAQRVCR